MVRRTNIRGRSGADQIVHWRTTSHRHFLRGRHPFPNQMATSRSSGIWGQDTYSPVSIEKGRAASFAGLFGEENDMAWNRLAGISFVGSARLHRKLFSGRVASGERLARMSDHTFIRSSQHSSRLKAREQQQSRPRQTNRRAGWKRPFTGQGGASPERHRRLCSHVDDPRSDGVMKARGTCRAQTILNSSLSFDADGIPHPPTSPCRIADTEA